MVLEIAEPTEARLLRCRSRLAEGERKALVGAIAAVWGPRASVEPLVILTSIELRRRLREAIEVEFPHVAVLCREELEEHVAWRDSRQIDWMPGEEA